MKTSRSAWLALITLGCFGSACEDAAVGDARPPCYIEPGGAFCSAGRCTLIVKPNSVAAPTALVFEERDVPPALRAESIGANLCYVGKEAAAFTRPAALRIAYDEAEILAPLTEDDLAPYLLDGDSQVLLTSVPRDTRANELEIAVGSEVLAGVTAAPQRVRPTIELGKDRFDVDDPVSFLRNVSSYNIHAAFFDGTRLYVGNGPRVLIYEGGVPSDPTRPPDVVLGRPDLASGRPELGAATLSGEVTGLWSDGKRLAVSAGSRVLIWNRIPSASFTPADVVLGQDTFAGDTPNRGGAPSASTLSSADDIASDGTRLLVADALNHRVLAFRTFPVLNAQAADLVIGQESFGDARQSGGAIPLYQARAVYLDPRRTIVGGTFACTCAHVIEGFPASSNPAFDTTIGVENTVTRTGPSAFAGISGLSRFGASGLALRDSTSRRVSIWREMPSRPDQPPDLVIGKPDSILGGAPLGAISASNMAGSSPTAGVFADEDLLMVPDKNRLLVWSKLPEKSYAPADFVFGQPAFTSNETGVDYRGLGALTLAHPASVARSGELVAVADRSNARVLILPRGFSTPEDEVVVLGQPDAKGFFPNRDWKGATARSMNGPSGVATDGVRLAVADTHNHRVLIFSRIPSESGAGADLVLGQPDSTSSEPNAGGASASARGMFYPSAVWIQDGALFVADSFNHRVLVFDPFPSENGAAASAILGQADEVGSDPNGGAGWFAPGASGLAVPSGLAFGSGVLWVADRENGRVAGFEPPWSTGQAATRVLGQPDLASQIAPGYYGPEHTSAGVPLPDARIVTSASTLRRPAGVTVVGPWIAVADTGNQRVVGFTPGGEDAVWVLGQESFDTRVPNAGGLGPSSLAAPEGLAAGDGELLVADTANHRLLRFAVGAAAPAPVADAVFGQIDFLGNGINRSANAPGRLKRPSGVSFDGARLWVADRDHHRVLAFEGDRPVLALGQVDVGRALVNGGKSAGPDTLWDPSDVFSDGKRLVVADRANHRVLIWNTLPSRNAQPADVVVGQPALTSTAPNAGGGILATASTLLAPEGVHVDGDTLYVADTGNNRVLAFDPIPQESGAAATRVLCQPDAAANLGNRGGADPAADTCAAPSDVHVAGGLIWVADTSNNRVLAFQRGASQLAVRVLGQPDFTSRSAVGDTGGADARSLSGPSSIEYDGANLYIVDRARHRVLVFAGIPAEDGAPADHVIGQISLTASVVTGDFGGLFLPNRIAVEALPFHRTRVYVADGGNDRVVLFDGVPRLRTPR